MLKDKLKFVGIAIYGWLPICSTSQRHSSGIQAVLKRSIPILIDPTILAYIFITLIAVACIFQLALALGAPWGEMAMGGKFPGRFPPSMRVAALIQIGLLVGMALIVLAHVGVAFSAFYEISKSLIWVVVVICAVSAIMNIITPSKKERALWAPITIMLFFCVTILAIN